MITSNNIKSLQIIATLDDGQHLLAVSNDKILIREVVVICDFVKLKEELFAQCSLKEIMD